MFESLELLALGIEGKTALWNSLQATAQVDSRLREFHFLELIRRAKQQREKVEVERIHLAPKVLAN